jgi:ABC-type spermidine/putrescine transport system permease subunit II
MERPQRSPFTATVTLVSLLFLFVPIAVVVLFSFHSTGGLSFPFRGFSLQWYRRVFDSPEFRDASINSLIVATATAAMTLVLGTFAAYGLSNSRSRLRGPLALLFFLPLTLPGLFIGLSLLVLFTETQIDASLTTVTIAHLVYVFPYFLLVALAALNRLDVALEEAAADLGANGWLVFRKVTLPQVWPVLVGAASLAFALSFDEFIITFFVIGADSTLPMFIWSTLRRTVNPSINAISSMLLLVTLVLFAVSFVLTFRGGRKRGGAIGGEELMEEALAGETFGTGTGTRT